MPFGKRLLTSAVKGESKQSCVIFPFYFMSSLAATVHNGCESLFGPFFMRITLIVYISVLADRLFRPTSAHFYIHCLFLTGLTQFYAQRYKKISNHTADFFIFCMRFDIFFIVTYTDTDKSCNFVP